HRSLTSKDIKFFQKKKEEKDKALLSEHHSMRMLQALSLMKDMSSEPVVLPANERRPLSRSRSPQEHRKRLFGLCWFFFSCCRRHPNSPILSERSRIAAKPSTGQKVHRLTPTLGVTQRRGKNRTF
ncbi:CPLN1 protein, partial [Bucorvus abyssinicus]|nr:CPLN1 protein [Bucorvus abyssinicus]